MRMLPDAILVLVTGLRAPIAAPAASLQEQISAAYAAWDAAFNKGEFERHCRLLYRGRRLPAADPRRPEGAGVTGHKLVLLEANGDGNTAVAAAKWSAKGKDGASLGGIATHEFVKQADDSYKLRLHTFN
jgi:ketosteroid isomerase-like protein